MEKLFMSASIVVAIVLCLVGVLKTPFKKLKEKHPNLYKAIFTIVTFVLAVGLSIIDEIYIICGSLWSIDFAILVCVVISGVFGGYNGVYEGMAVKNLFKNLTEKTKQALKMSKHNKAVKYLNKVEDIDEAINILIERKNKNSEV